jgi:hypothetical protein
MSGGGTPPLRVPGFAEMFHGERGADRGWACDPPSWTSHRTRVAAETFPPSGIVKNARAPALTTFLLETRSLLQTAVTRT